LLQCHISERDYGPGRVSIIPNARGVRRARFVLEFVVMVFADQI
jgi:hypothetical protein